MISDVVSAVDIERLKMLLYNANILRDVIILVLKTIFSIVFKLCYSVLDSKELFYIQNQDLRTQIWATIQNCLCVLLVYELLYKTVTPKENQKMIELSTLLFFFFLRWYSGEQKTQALVSKTVSDLASSSLYFSVLWESYLTLFESQLFIHNMQITNCKSD